MRLSVLTNKELFFIEFKTNAVLKSNESREENHRKACNQLLNTISEVQTRCQNVEVDLLKTAAIEAYQFSTIQYLDAALRKSDILHIFYPSQDELN